MSPADGERRLNSAIAPKPGAREAVGEPHERENSTSSSSRAAAAPESIASRAAAIPSLEALRMARGGDPAGRVEEHGRAMAAVRAARAPPAGPRRSSAGSPPRSSSGSQRSMPSSSGSSSYSRTVPAVDLADEVRPARGELVDAAGTVHDVGARRLELDERVGERPRELRRVDAEHEGARPRRVRQAGRAR